jgi:BMFP domain-containing protein YqiC
MPLPTMSLRAAPEYHQLIRDIATALRTRPELADALRNVLQSQHSVALRDTDVLQSILDRIAALEEREPRMVRIEALEARITALEEPPASRPHTPRPSSAGKRRSPKGVTGKPPP